MSKKKSTGNIRTFNIDIEQPMKMKEMSLDLKALTLLCATNGSGKTFFMINTFALCYIAQAIVHSKPPKNHVIEVADFTMKHCLTDCNTHGTITAKFESDSELTVKMENGTVVDVEWSGFDEVESAIQVKYLSSQMRTFEAMSMYLKVRKAHKSLSHPEILYKMLADFKLFDVAYLEGLIISMPIKMDERIKDTLMQFDIKDNILEFNVDLDKGEFYAVVDTPENRKALSRYSNGEQSMINMVIGAG